MPRGVRGARSPRFGRAPETAAWRALRRAPCRLRASFSSLVDFSVPVAFSKAPSVTEESAASDAEEAAEGTAGESSALRLTPCSLRGRATRDFATLGREAEAEPAAEVGGGVEAETAAVVEVAAVTASEPEIEAELAPANLPPTAATAEPLVPASILANAAAPACATPNVSRETFSTPPREAAAAARSASAFNTRGLFVFRGAPSTMANEPVARRRCSSRVLAVCAGVAFAACTEPTPASSAKPRAPRASAIMSTGLFSLGISPATGRHHNQTPTSRSAPRVSAAPAR